MGGIVQPAGEPKGRVTAIDASTGAVKWQYDSRRPMVSAVTATAGDLVFTGELTGDFVALDARWGDVCASASRPAAPSAAALSPTRSPADNMWP